MTLPGRDGLDDARALARRSGWWSLLVWLSLGLVLESLHACKIGWYLDVGQETRRLLLTLAHVHGTLLALVQLAFAATMPAGAPGLARAAGALRWAGILMPLGFLGGGVWAVGGDPGIAVALVPIGGLLLLYGVAQAARSVG